MADTVVDQLAALLHAIDMPPLYILVGHSLGGFYAQAFARKRPAEVAAVVLVDAASPFEPPGVFVSTVPPKPGSIEAAEEAGFAPSVKAMLAGPPFPPVPVIVLAATNHGDTREREALWRETQARTAALSPKGQLRIADGSGHFIQIDRPQAVVDAVLEALRQTGRTFLLVRQPTRSVEATRELRPVTSRSIWLDVLIREWCFVKTSASWIAGSPAQQACGDAVPSPLQARSRHPARAQAGRASRRGSA